MKFSDIIGHEDAKRRLRDMVDAERMPHALLLSGPSGVGALALARALAQYIHCSHRRSGESCGVCPACLQHQSLNNADMHYIFPIVKRKSEGLILSADYAPVWHDFLALGPYASWEDWLALSKAGNSQPVIYVEESAEIVRRMNLSNYAARYKIALIWLPEKLQPEAANKLLKIIEEPFADTLFLMVSEHPEQILPTIYSRTQRVELTRLTDAEVSELLTSVYGVDPGLAPEIASRAEGSMTRAIELTGTGGEHDEFAPLFREMMRKAYMRDVKELRVMADTIAAMGREKARRCMDYCAVMVRENFIYNLQVGPLLSMDDDEIRFSSRFAPFINAANAEYMLDLFSTAGADISRNANAKIVMFDTLLRLIVALQLKPQ